MDITVITPFHNVDLDIFEACFQSMISQTVGIDHIEWIIVLHNCEQKYIDAVKRKVSPYKTVLTPVLVNDARTPSSPRNYGLTLATGKYIGFLDGDDSYIPTCVETALKNIESTHSDILCFKREYELENSNQVPIGEGILLDQTKEKIMMNKYTWEAEKTFVSVWGMVTSKIYSRDFLKKYDLRFDERIPFGEDAEFNLRAYPLAEDICYLTQYVGYHYYINSASLVQVARKDAATLIDYARGFEQIFKTGMKRGIFMNNMIGGLLYHMSRFLEVSDIDVDSRKQIRDILLPYLRIVKPFEVCAIYSEEDVKLRYDYPKKIIPVIDEMNIWDQDDRKEYAFTTSQIYQETVMKAGGAGIEAIELDRYYELDDDIDEEKLRTAVYETLCAHDIYRARMKNQLMRISDDMPVVALYYFTDKLFREYRKMNYSRKINCENESPIQADIICCVEDFSDYDANASKEYVGKKYLHIKACHFVYDQVGLYHILREAGCRYIGDLTGIPEENQTMFDLSEKEKQLKMSEQYMAARHFFKDQYTGRGSGRVFEKHNENTMMVQKIVTWMDADQFEQIIRSHDLTTGVFLIGMFEKTIADVSGRTDFSYIILSDDRNTEEKLNTHGTLAKGVYITSTIGAIKDEKIAASDPKIRSEFFCEIKNKIKNSITYNVLDFSEVIGEYPNMNSLITVNYIGKDKYKHRFLGQELPHRFSAEHLSEMKTFSALNFNIEKSGKTFILVAMSDSFSKEQLTSFISQFEHNIEVALL